MANVPGLEPWHLWGNHASIDVTVGGLAPANHPTGQLARINYKRPDTFRFLFGFEILKLPPPSGADKIDLFVDFDVIAGIGRSSLIMAPNPNEVNQSGFASFRVNDTPTNLTGLKLWTSTVRARQTLGDGFDPPTFDTLVAQDIQCLARVRAVAGLSPLAGTHVLVACHAYFAPNVHIRPEWFTDKHGDESRYRAAEDGGS